MKKSHPTAHARTWVGVALAAFAAAVKEWGGGGAVFARKQSKLQIVQITLTNSTSKTSIFEGISF